MRNFGILTLWYQHFLNKLFERLNLFITDNVIVIADVGDSLFGALDLTIHGQTHFLSPAYYLSMGFAVPAAIGAQLANPKLRPIVIVGDGAFQMTAIAILPPTLSPATARREESRFIV